MLEGDALYKGIISQGSEKMQWCVQYANDTIVQEHPDGKSFSQMDMHNVKNVLIFGEFGVFCCKIPPSSTPVFFRRRSINVMTGAASTAHCIGYEGDYGKSYLFVFDDGSVLLTEDKNAI